MPKKLNKSSRRFLRNFLKTSIFTKLLLISGFLFVIIPTFFFVNETVQLAFFTPKVTEVKRILPPPSWISIKSVGMELPVFEEAISGSTWGISTDGISHLNISANPGEEGPIILYGHNTNNRFGPIRWLSPGSQVDLLTTDGKHHLYKIVKTEQVDASFVTVLTSQKGENLILYTCDGFADLKRFIVIARPSD